jgi:hypothetical protein
MQSVASDIKSRIGSGCDEQQQRVHESRLYTVSRSIPGLFFGRSESMESQMMSGVADNVFVVEAISPVEALSIPMLR